LDGGFDFGFCAGGEAAFLKSGGGAQGREGDMDVLFFKHFEGCMGVGFVGWGDGEGIWEGGKFWLELSGVQ
jgi:hypothetical protein